MEKTKNNIKVAVIGCGLRSRNVVSHLLQDSNRQIDIVAVYDPDLDVVKHALETWKINNTKICKSYQEAIYVDGVEWVMIFSPNAYHCEQILASFEAKKHVFSEKPLATSIEDCQKIYIAHQKNPELLFATGFVLRYANIYQKAKELLSSGELGELLTIQGNENVTPQHGNYIMRNWRRLSKIAGPHILEKCCHDLDLINWFVGSIPIKVSAFGSRRFFKPENRNLEGKYGVEKFNQFPDPHAIETGFSNDTDLIDTQVCITEYQNGVVVNFSATMSNAIPERRLYFSCTEGTMIIELYSMKLTWRKIFNDEKHEINYVGDGHGGGDNYIMKALWESMSKGVPPKCSGNEGLESAVYAMAIDQAMREGNVVDIMPIWKSLGRK